MDQIKICVYNGEEAEASVTGIVQNDLRGLDSLVRWNESTIGGIENLPGGLVFGEQVSLRESYDLIMQSVHDKDGKYKRIIMEFEG